MLKSWILHVQYYLNNNHTSFNSSNSSYLVPIIVLINKADIKANRKFKISDVTKLADEFTLNILIVETSAKENSKLDYVFEKVAGLVSGRISMPNETSVNTTALEEEGGIEDLKERVGRRKSFQLKEGKAERSQGSCCNSSG
jgi:Fe2+ transport system protein B